MKKTFTYYTMSSSAKVVFRITVLAILLFGFSKDDKITICHIPPGNPENCHQITISMEALQTHLEHGDRLFCYDELKYNDYLKLVDNNTERVIKMYERH